MSHVDPDIFREYIGVKSDPTTFDNFPEIINPEVKQFHFIVGFAKDTYDTEGNGTGNFYVNWNSEFFGPQHVNELKRKHPYVKVVLSIGGRDADCPFFPAAKEEWWSNAVNSLKVIIGSYNGLIDGIDINYVTVKSSDADFSYCIGKVIKELKQYANMVSIAPSLPSQSPYKTLYLDMPGDIDYVDYQFYIQKIDKGDFISLFRNLSLVYTLEKLLVGGSTDKSDADNFKREDFIEGCKALVNDGSLRGIFIWNANDSFTDDPPFSLETKAQNVLIKKAWLI